jgi:hypothetical protein
VIVRRRGPGAAVSAGCGRPAGRAGRPGIQDAYDTIAGIEDDLGALLGPRGPLDLRRALRRTADAQSAEDGCAAPGVLM